MSFARLLVPALCAALLPACQTLAPVAPAADTAPPAAAPVATTPAASADDNLNAVVWMQTSAEYRAASEQAYRAAARLLDAALKNPRWTALTDDEQSDQPGLPPAVVLDIDETVLDNSPYQARLIAEGREYDEATWAQWVQERRARPIAGVADFVKAARERGITVVYISNRAKDLDVPTLDNLRALGLPADAGSEFLGLGTFVRDCEQEGSEKHCRRLQVGRKYRVIMQFGDQLGDFAQIGINTWEGRAALYAKHRAWFGERWWMIPNPSYGSWEPALFNNDYRQPREARRQAKREALDLAR